MRLRLLSRNSALAVLQAGMVARALRRADPELEITLVQRSSQGDRDGRVALWEAPDKGLFTADLSQALVEGHAELAVHSWKDLPIADVPGTHVAGTLERADPRDVLLVRRPVLDARPATLSVLSSSPRRAWQLDQSLGPLLPWSCERISTIPVRGNIPTRLHKLRAGDADALVVAKAALDRLLSDASPEGTRDDIRGALDGCQWMVLPISRFPTAPAQGALAIEVANGRSDIHAFVHAVSHEPSRLAAETERALLAQHGGGCHEALGATVLMRDYGVITSVRGRTPAGDTLARWDLAADRDGVPRAPGSALWPQAGERRAHLRLPLAAVLPADADALFVTRDEALPSRVTVPHTQLVWVSGIRTWEKLARRGIWVNGSADGLGDAEPTGVALLAGREGREPHWLRLTHAGSTDPKALATYQVRHEFPADMGARTHFYWMSGSAFRDAVTKYPHLRQAWHASGPGRTAQAIQDVLGPTGRHSIWLEYDQWHRHVTS